MLVEYLQHDNIKRRYVYGLSACVMVQLRSDHAPSYSSSEGSISGNHPYSLKSTISSPRAPVVTVTPSALSAVAWFCEPDGADLSDRAQTY